MRSTAGNNTWITFGPPDGRRLAGNPLAAVGFPPVMPGHRAGLGQPGRGGGDR